MFYKFRNPWRRLRLGHATQHSIAPWTSLDVTFDRGQLKYIRYRFAYHAPEVVRAINNK